MKSRPCSKNPKLWTFEIDLGTDHKRKRFSIRKRFLNSKLQRACEAMFEEIEEHYLSKEPLSKDSKETLLTITNHGEDWEHRLQALGAIAEIKQRISDYTVDQAWNSYTARRGVEETWADGTYKNWKNCWERIQAGGFDPNKKLSEVTGIYLLECLEALRLTYRYKTLDKDCKNFVQMFTWYANKGRFEDNELEGITFNEKFVKGESIQGGNPKETEEITEEMFWDAFEKITLVPLHYARTTYDRQPSLEHQTLFAYWFWLGARKMDPVGDKWEDIDWEKNTVNRFCGKKKRKLKDPCPIPWQFLPTLTKWRDEVIKRNGEAKGRIFPYLSEVDGSAVYNFYFDRLKVRTTHNGKECWLDPWKGLIQSLRVTRSKRLRTDLPNGRYLESIWIGHAQDVADANYDFTNSEDFRLITESKAGRTTRESGAA